MAKKTKSNLLLRLVVALLLAATGYLVYRAATLTTTVEVQLAPPSENRAAYAAKIYKSAVMLYAENSESEMLPLCTATAIASSSSHTEFLSASHCFSPLNGEEPRYFITQDHQNYHPVSLIYAGDQKTGNDFSIFSVKAFPLPTIPLGDFGRVKTADPVINVSAPAGYELQTFFGTVSEPRFDHPFNFKDDGVNWTGYLLVDIHVAPGSSGSAIVSMSQNAIIGVVVGIAMDNGAITATFALPIDRVEKYLASCHSHVLS